MKLTTLASVALLTLGASGVVHAQGGAHVSFASADSDKDGRLSVAELKMAMPDVTIEDADEDGYVSRSEAEASITGLTFEGDAGGDGEIAEAEFAAIVAQLHEEDDSPTRGPGAGAAGAGRAGAGGAAVGAGAGGGAGAGDAEGDTDN